MVFYFAGCGRINCRCGPTGGPRCVQNALVSLPLRKNERTNQKKEREREGRGKGVAKPIGMARVVHGVAQSCFVAKTQKASSPGGLEVAYEDAGRL